MSFDPDEEILQDFLIESGEILEQLSEQLVDLEQRPDDFDLLNAIFRGFHTVKGGAGFLQLDNLVELCHVAENVFDLLRNSKLQVSPELMDVVLQALDSVNEMFELVQAREELSPAPAHIIQGLEHLVKVGNGEVPADEAIPGAEVQEQEPTTEEAISQEQAEDDHIDDEQVSELLSALNDEDSSDADQVAEQQHESTIEDKQASDVTDSEIDLFDMSEESAQQEDITEHELKALLNAAGRAEEVGGQTENELTGNTSESSSQSEESDLITDDEFEQLLDELHGKKNTAKEQPADEEKASGTVSQSESENKTGLMTENEFDSLLDDLYGQGKGPTSSSPPSEAPPVATKKDQQPSSKPFSSGKQGKPAEKAPAKPKETAREPSPAKQSVNAAPAANANPGRPRGASKPAVQKETVIAETTVRVDTKRLDDIMNMVGELVLVRNRLVRLGLSSSDEDLQKAVANLDVVTADIQMSVMKTRMQPIKKVFGRFPRVVRDLARNLKKEINLDLEGEETDLDKNLVEALSDPLVHLVRNSVDHGIEMPAEREAAGKPRIGKILLSAEQEGDHIILSITDDGGGMDPDVLRAKAVEKELMDEEAAERLSDEEAFNLIFHPGFSTKTEISDVSGRGVGMDVVKTKISQLNGTINIHSELGVGTRIAIKVPLTLAIMPTLMVKLDEQAFALPLVSVNEIFHLDLERTNVVDGQEVVIVRDKAVPLFYLKRWLVPGYQGDLVSESAHVVVITVGTTKVGLVVDQLIGQEEVVIKPLGKMLHGTPGMAGATITGDGSIAIILDVPSLIKQYA